MAEYIDREEYCEKHCRCSNENCDKESCPIWKAPTADVAPVVHAMWDKNGDCTNCKKHAPTVDAVVVTRCKDCKYGVADCCGEYVCGHPEYELCEGVWCYPGDYFCAYGEPKEG